MPVTNLGILGNPWYPFFGDENAAEWPAGTGVEHMNYGALWVGARDASGVVHVSTGFSDQKETEFRPEDDARATIYRSYEGIAGGVRVGSLLDPDDDGDGFIDEEVQNGLDDDGDGLVDEDFAAAADQMFTCQFSDTTRAALTQNPEHTPLGLAVTQRTFQWSTPGLDDFVGFEYTIQHTGTKPLTNVYLGFFLDADVGPRKATAFWADDIVGYTSTSVERDALNDIGKIRPECENREVPISVGWLRDHTDPPPSVHGDPGSLRQTPTTPGYVGLSLFTHVLDVSTGASTRVTFHALRREQDANSDADKYLLMRSATEVPKDTVTGDYRYLMSVGPFPVLRPGEKLVLAGAIVCAPTHEELMTQTATASLAYEGRWVNADRNSATGANGKETCFTPGAQVLVDDDCDPSTRRIAIAGTICKPENYINLDCDPCSPAVNGAETPLHWAAPLNPPLPGQSAGGPGTIGVKPDAASQNVTIAWDNLPEIVPDPNTGYSLVAGYRVWKAANWTRPQGSRGPSSDLWMLVADIALDPRDSTATPIAAVRDDTVQPSGELFGRAYYPVGRYRYVDTHVLPGVPYFYAVTPYRIVPNQFTTVKVARPPVATQDDMVILDPPARSDLAKFTIVPNPYRGAAGWDLTPNASDPTGTKIGFFGLPRGHSTIKIYTLFGDLVQTLEHDGGDGNGGTYWDLRTRSGQDAVSGVYIVRVVSGSFTAERKLIVVRGR